MAKVTSKLQLTLPKRLAEEYRIEPGDEIEFQAAGDYIRIVPPQRRFSRRRLTTDERLRLFDESTARQAEREKHMKIPKDPPTDRGWTREELYTRGKAD